MTELKLRQSMIDASLKLAELGFVYGTWGNISIRYQDGMLITPSRIPYEEMTAGDIVFIRLDNCESIGNRTASSEKQVHRLIYINRPDAGAIIHCHSTYATAAAAIGEPVPPVTEEMCQLVGGEIPVTSYFVPSSHHDELGREAASCIRDKNALLLRNHGPVCCGRDLGEAMITCQVVEKAARIFISIMDKQPCIIDEQWVRDGRDYFLNRYGKEN